MRFNPEPSFAHNTPARTAVLLVNLGTPAAPTPSAVRAYLAEFLSDPRVVEIPRPIWWLILNGIILRVRPRKSAAKYAAIWTDEGSPLAVHTTRQAQLLRGYLGEQTKLPLIVTHAMRYGEPSIARTLGELKAQNVTRLLVLPLYPQYAASTTATVFDEIFKFYRSARNMPEIRLVRSFGSHPAYIAALAATVRDNWARDGRPDKLVMSFHGVPKFTLLRGDPYHCECLATARLLAEHLGLTKDAWQVTFQSRFGRAEWLQPYTEPTLEALARDGVRRIDVITPGFTSDCLETLEEIGMEAKDTFLRAGGTTFNSMPCLNEDPRWIAALATIATEHLGSWLTSCHEQTLTAAQLAARQQRAKAIGAMS